MDSLNIKNLVYSAKDVGKHIASYKNIIIQKRTKKYYCWEFELDDKYRKIELFHSVLSEKRKIVYNGNVIREDDGYVHN